MDGGVGQYTSVCSLFILLVDYPHHVCSLGDLKFKPFGVTPEPEVRSKLLRGKYLVRLNFLLY